jgi:hypothetical protein
MRILTCFLLAVSVITIARPTYAQKLVVEEGFEPKPGKSPTDTGRLFLLDPGVPSKPSAINLYTDRNSPPFVNFYTENRCNQDSGQHGFYTSIKLYDRHVSESREILAIRLDTLLPGGRSGNMSLDVLYHYFAEYRVDSIQAVLLRDRPDIRAWFSGRAFVGQYICFSLGDVDNRAWRHLDASFVTEHAYRYLLIGNLETDSDCKVIRANNCDCCPRPKNAYQAYSELLIDNVRVAIN